MKYKNGEFVKVLPTQKIKIIRESEKIDNINIYYMDDLSSFSEEQITNDINNDETIFALNMSFNSYLKEKTSLLTDEQINQIMQNVIESICES